MIARINNITELHAERLRLQAVRSAQETVLYGRVENVQKKFLPYRNLFRHAENFFSGKSSSQSMQNAIQTGVPFIVDRFFLGTKGLMLKKAATWISEFAAVRLSQEIPSDMMQKISRFIPVIIRLPFVKKLIRSLRD